MTPQMVDLLVKSQDHWDGDERRFEWEIEAAASEVVAAGRRALNLWGLALVFLGAARDTSGMWSRTYSLVFPDGAYLSLPVQSAEPDHQRALASVYLCVLSMPVALAAKAEQGAPSHGYKAGGLEPKSKSVHCDPAPLWWSTPRPPKHLDAAGKEAWREERRKQADAQALAALDDMNAQLAEVLEERAALSPGPEDTPSPLHADGADDTNEIPRPAGPGPDSPAVPTVGTAAFNGQTTACPERVAEAVHAEGAVPSAPSMTLPAGNSREPSRTVPHEGLPAGGVAINAGAAPPTAAGETHGTSAEREAGSAVGRSDQPRGFGGVAEAEAVAMAGEVLDDMSSALHAAARAEVSMALGVLAAVASGAATLSPEAPASEPSAKKGDHRSRPRHRWKDADTCSRCQQTKGTAEGACPGKAVQAAVETTIEDLTP